MNLLERKIFNQKSTLRRLRDEQSEDGCEFTAVRALEIAEDDHGDACVCGADRRISGDIQLGEIVGVGVGSGVEHFAAKEGLAVFANEYGALVGLSVDGYLYGDS